jgi:hypothetical protein
MPAHSGKPYQSKLLPYIDEIRALRSTWPPTPYREIAAIFKQKYGLDVDRTTIFSFVKVRSGRRKSWVYGPLSKKDQPSVAAPPATAALSPALERLRQQPAASQTESARPKFSYTPSDRYNLTRLTPEQSKAREERRDQELPAGRPRAQEAGSVGEFIRLNKNPPAPTRKSLTSFTPSAEYNLERLTPEEMAAWLKELEERKRKEGGD